MARDISLTLAVMALATLRPRIYQSCVLGNSQETETQYSGPRHRRQETAPSWDERLTNDGKDGLVGHVAFGTLNIPSWN